MSFGLEVLDRIDANNDPVNWVDPDGLRIKVSGSPEQQSYTLKQLEKFVNGTLGIDSDGYLTRNSCDPCEEGSIESDIDRLIASDNTYVINAELYDKGSGRSQTVPSMSGGGANIYYDPNVDANYASGFLSVDRITPAAELAHELLGRATQIEDGIPHGRPGSKTRRCSNNRAVDKANEAYKRMGMKERSSYN